MAKVRLGRTNLTVNKNGFGALPVQRRTKDDAVAILRHAYESGIDFYDTARAYSDSEEKLGIALSHVRDKIVIATKTGSRNTADFWKHLETSLSLLKTTYIDIYQFHNPSFCPKPNDGTGLYEAMLEAKTQGKIRFIGITNHSREVCMEAIESGLYDTVQFPFSYLCGEEDIALVNKCRERDVGFICMKALSGGLITNAKAAYAFMARFENALPIWGIQRMEELEQFLECESSPPAWDQEMESFIEREKKQLAGDFCRGCGYCLPCPANIPINNAARMTLLLHRSPPAQWLTPEWQEAMRRINNCIHCRHCANHCPYHLDTPALLKKNLAEYEAFLRDWKP
ncbi:MAG: aldo/keto reductase [Christensenellales bacterium]|jgi:aryl-alcohol dehydrogenase-like predicted oxidoreductase